ncbi:MAG: hydrogenase nickel incorporation protein HypB [Kiritimatiellae bacterium]|nr:hydrogenase nickel incorporation protein HypB [Kiritimatiellia bacterium]
MCDHCGCSTPSSPHAHSHAHEHAHTHSQDRGHHHHHHDHDEERRTIALHQSLMAKNDRLAEQNRGFFKGRGTLALNIVSSPGSGKTAILEATLRALQDDFKMATIVGDLATDNDAARLRATGAPSIQITTGTVCHLDAHMIQHAIEDLGRAPLDLLFIENVGNLVCPAGFDLGEDVRVVVTSVTEGEDKPQKYPSIFQNADIVLVNKMDLAEAVGYDRKRALEILHNAAPGALILELSARTGAGMDAWYNLLRARIRAKVGTEAKH